VASTSPPCRSLNCHSSFLAHTQFVHNLYALPWHTLPPVHVSSPSPRRPGARHESRAIGKPTMNTTCCSWHDQKHIAPRYLSDRSCRQQRQVHLGRVGRADAEVGKTTRPACIFSARVPLALSRGHGRHSVLTPHGRGDTAIDPKLQRAKVWLQAQLQHLPLGGGQ
jgi:hypothetical protein